MSFPHACGGNPLISALMDARLLHAGMTCGRFPKCQQNLEQAELFCIAPVGIFNFSERLRFFNKLRQFLKIFNEQRPPAGLVQGRGRVKHGHNKPIPKALGQPVNLAD